MLPYFQFAMLYNFLFASHSMPQSVRRFQSIFKIPTSYGPVFWKSNLAKNCPKNTIEEAFLPLSIGTIFAIFVLLFNIFTSMQKSQEHYWQSIFTPFNWDNFCNFHFLYEIFTSVSQVYFWQSIFTPF